MIRPIPNDNEPNVTCFNDLLLKLSETGSNRWFTAPWLFAEYDLPRLIFLFWVILVDAICRHIIPILTYACMILTHLEQLLDIGLLEHIFLQLDSGRHMIPFTLKKRRRSDQAPPRYLVNCPFSRVPIWFLILTFSELAHTFIELGDQKDDLDEAKLEILFKEVLQICLWYVCVPSFNTAPSHRATIHLFNRGNATVRRVIVLLEAIAYTSQDLSLLTNMSHEDIQKLQMVERDAQEARKEFILIDQSTDAWNLLRNGKSGRVDIVLDNGLYFYFFSYISLFCSSIFRRSWIWSRPVSLSFALHLMSF